MSQFPDVDSVSEAGGEDIGGHAAAASAALEQQLALIPNKRRKVEHQQDLPEQPGLPTCCPCCLCGGSYEDCVHVSVCMRVRLCHFVFECAPFINLY